MLDWFSIPFNFPVGLEEIMEPSAYAQKQW